MSLTRAALVIALRALFSEPVEIALMVGDEELADGGYRRQRITLALTTLPEGAVVVNNPGELRFGALREETQVTDWQIWNRDTLLVEGGFVDPLTARRGEEIIILKGALIVGIKP